MLAGRSGTRHRVIGFLAALMTLLAGLGIAGIGHRTRLTLGSGGTGVGPVLDAASWSVCAVGLVTCAGALAFVLLRPTASSRVMLTVATFSAIIFVFGVFAWAARDRGVNIGGTLGLGVSAAIPIMLGATAGALSERSGVLNIAIEAKLLAGAFAGALVGSISDNAWIGILAAAGAGALVGGLLAVTTLRFGADQIVIGIVLIALLLGLTGFLTEQVLDPNAQTLNSPALLGDLEIPLLDRLPVVGRALFAQNVLFYLAIAAAVGVELFLRHTSTGLRIRAVGQSPGAASAAGVNVRRLRYGAVLTAGAIAGVGGSYFTLGSAGQFVAGMTQGLGFVALAAVIIGARRATVASAASIAFGFAISISTVFGLLDVSISPSLLMMLPYAITILVVSGFVPTGRLTLPGTQS